MRSRFACSAAVLLLAASMLFAQGVDLTDRPVAEVRVTGLEVVSEQLVRNQIRIKAGDPYDAEVVRSDVTRITHLGRFETVVPQVTPLEDGSIVITYALKEQPLLADVQVVGNKALTDGTLLGKVVLRSGDPADPFLIERGRQQIIAAYEEKGYFVADAKVDKELLSDQGILIYQIREGPRVRIRNMAFEGNEVYSNAEIHSQVRSKTYFPILRNGDLSREQLELDAARIRDYYRERGYLDAQVGRRIDLSPNNRDATVVFLVEEGRRYVVDQVRVEGALVLPAEQIRKHIELVPGSVFTMDKVRKSEDIVEAMYGRLGFIQARVAAERFFHDDEPKVDVLIRVDEGRSYTVGTVSVRGNELTKEKVILRQVRGMTPGRPFDGTGVDKTRERLQNSPLFNDGKVTITGNEDDAIRDVLIEVEERNTGSVSFGAGVSSDLGVIGAIDVVQRNFDIFDYPESAGELFSGRAFRGAGQYFSLSLQPGNETSRYAVSFREPYLLETDNFMDTSAYLFERLRDKYDESRMGGNLGFGRRFGDVWSVSVQGRGSTIDISGIDDDAPVDVFAVEGESMLTVFGVNATRSTVDSRITPSRGSRFEVGLERGGGLGGDYDFTRVTSKYQKFWTVDEDFLERKTVFSFRGEVGYLFDDAPVFERFYAGGHSTFRGFKYRGVGPRGVRADNGEIGDDPVGGSWLLLAGAQYEFPLMEDYLRGVFFTDQGTVDSDVAFDSWRVSVGTGLRIKLPIFGQAPFAIDVAYPILKESGDETQLISFDVAIPFR